MRHQFHPQRGFSILELVVALSLMGILTAIVAPSFASAIDRDHTTRTADRFISDMNFARMTAVRTGEPVLVEFEAGGRGYDITVGDGEDGPERSVRLDRSFGGTELSGQPITFNSRGMLNVNQPVEVVVRARDGRTITLTALAAGRFVERSAR